MVRVRCRVGGVFGTYYSQGGGLRRLHPPYTEQIVYPPVPPATRLSIRTAMSLPTLPSVALPPPTRVRYKVLAYLCVLALILYIDRICISQAVPAIEAELGIDDTQMSYVLAAFTFAYCLFEVPTGSWGDRYGSRGVMARIVVWWSVFTALTGAAPGL